MLLIKHGIWTHSELLKSNIDKQLTSEVQIVKGRVDSNYDFTAIVNGSKQIVRASFDFLIS